MICQNVVKGSVKNPVALTGPLRAATGRCGPLQDTNSTYVVLAHAKKMKKRAYTARMLRSLQ